MNDEAVSDVLGNVLLVGITVALMAGMSVAVLFIGGPAETVHANLSVDLLRGGDSWGDGDEGVRLRHVGGEEVRAGVRVTVVVDGASTAFVPGDQGFSDGVLRTGESWVGTAAIAEGARVLVVVADPGTNALLARSGTIVAGGSSGGVSTVFTYVDAGTAATGTLTNFSAAQSASDSGAAAVLREASSPGAPATATVSATTVASSTGATDPANVLQSDDARATFLAQGDAVAVEGFSVPSDATVSSVVLGFEAQRSGGGALAADLRLSYTVAGAAGATGLTATVSATSDTAYTVDVTADRAWTRQDLADLRLVLVRDSVDAGVRDAAVDHLFATVTYTVPVTDLDATFDFAGVPAGTHTLQLRYHASGDSFQVQVWDGSAWNARGTLAATSPTTFTHALTAAEFNGGAPRLRFVDLATGGDEGVLNIDYARVASS